MRHHIFEESEYYDVALLIKSSAFDKREVTTQYVLPLEQQGVKQSNMIAFTLAYEHGKANAGFIKDYLAKLMPVLQDLKSTILYVADTAYFKILAGQTKAEPHLGYALPCKIRGYEHMTVVLGVNHQALIYNPALQEKLNMSLKTVATKLNGSYQAIGANIIHSANYPSDPASIKTALDSLLAYPELTCDIEGFSLRFNEAGIATIAFAWDEHNGIAFACDYKKYAEAPAEKYWGWKGENHEVRKLLKQFFINYKGHLVFHNANYDLKALIYTLWMEHPLDNRGLLEGLETLTKHLDDTKIIAYLALNSTAGNVLGLKSLAHEFAGNWAKDDIKDVRLIPLPELLKYNLVDALSTNYAKKKYYPIMVADQQEDLYKSLMLPSLKLIVQMELTGMPMVPGTIAKTRAELEQEQQAHLALVQSSPLIQSLNHVLQVEAMDAANAKLKKKQHPLEKFKDVVFNPNSGPQLQTLLYDLMKLPVLDYTDKKQPATGADTLKKLVNHATDPAHKDILLALVAYSKVTKILSTFIPAFEAGILKSNGRIYLHGSYNLGGTVSGRLSSSDPNMQNLPSGSKYGKLIKECFAAPDGWLMVGADFNSLEDYISALTTKDPNKLAVYEQGFDGHCLRAAYYFREECPDIDPTDPVSVNSMKEKYPKLRQESKAPTFLLTYGGTYHGMMSNLGWSEEKAKAIEKGYHDLYQVSDAYIQSRLQQASKDGYVEVAFGLRVRTPLLKQVMFGTDSVPYEAAAESRTAGNAMGQSYGLLNNRAAVDFWQKVWASEYRNDILPCSLIHDAIYAIVRNDVAVVEWVNRELIKSMQWQDLPEIQHPTVKLGAALDIFYPSWAKPTTLPNNATRETILSLCP